MVETKTLTLSLDELKILLTALHSFRHSLENKKSRRDTLLSIYDAEKFFNFDFEIETLVLCPAKFIDESLGLSIDKLSEAFYELAEITGTAKPLPLEDERCSAIELLNFCVTDFKTPVLEDLS